MLKSFCKSFEDPKAKLGFFIPKSALGYTNLMCGGSVTVLKNFKFVDGSMNLGIARNSILYESLNEILEKLGPSGIFQHLINYDPSVDYPIFDSAIEKPPRILTLDDLSFGFVLWLVACCISIVGFAVEVTEYNLRILIKNMVGIGIFLIAVQWEFL